MTWIDADLVRHALTLPSELPVLACPPAAREAAVLVPVVLAGGPARVLVQVRGAGLRDHGGELAFPGGKPEPGDVDLQATAVREAREEIGLEPAQVTVVGELGRVPVITRKYVVRAFVGLVTAGPLLAPSPRVSSPETERLIALPLGPWLEGAMPVYATVDRWDDQVFDTPFFRLPGGEVLYGTGAFFLFDLLQRVARAAGREPIACVIETDKPWGRRYSDLVR